MSTPFVLTLRTNLYQQGGGVKKIEGAIETRTCGAFYAGTAYRADSEGYNIS